MLNQALILEHSGNTYVCVLAEYLWEVVPLSTKNQASVRLLCVIIEHLLLPIMETVPGAPGWELTPASFALGPKLLVWGCLRAAPGLTVDRGTLVTWACLNPACHRVMKGPRGQSLVTAVPQFPLPHNGPKHGL